VVGDVEVVLPAKRTWSAEIAHALRASWPKRQEPLQSKFEGPVHSTHAGSHCKQRPMDSAKYSPPAHVALAATRAASTQMLPGSLRMLPSSAALK